MGTTILILQKVKLKLREVKQFVQGHPDFKP